MVRHENSAKTDGRALRCVRAVWEKDPKPGRKKPGRQSVCPDRRPKHHSTLKVTNGMPVRWLKNKQRNSAQEGS